MISPGAVFRFPLRFAPCYGARMHRTRRIFLLLTFLMSGPAATATPEAAERVQRGYQLSMEKWVLESRLATTSAERLKAEQSRPDARKAAADMWLLISPALDKEWTLEPAAWFLRMTGGMVNRADDGSSTPAFATETEAILKALENHHLGSGKLQPMCMSLAQGGDPRRLNLLEKISNSHPDAAIQGVASLAAAMAMKSLGDEPELLRKRLSHLRKAIIQSSDVDINGNTVAKIAEDELYVIRFLSKGRVSPDLSGTDSAGRPLKLSDFKGKVVVLMFWHSNDPELDRVIAVTAAMTAKFRDKPVEIIGVNHDPLAKLRAMQADGVVTWRNFSDPEFKLSNDFRVGMWPLVYVLDGDRKIHHVGSPGSFVELAAEALAAEIKPVAGE
jgi:peroxiredoxin